MSKIPTYPGEPTYPGWSEGSGGGSTIVEPPPGTISFKQIDPIDPVAMRFGGLTIGCRDSEGGAFWVTKNDSLHEISTTYETAERAYADGSVTSQGFLQAKHATIGISVCAPFGGSVHDRLDVLKRALPFREEAPIVVRDWGRVYIFLAQVEDKVTVERISKYRFDVTVPLFIPDPVLMAADWNKGAPAWTSRKLGLTPAQHGLPLPFSSPFTIPADSQSSEDSLRNFEVNGSAPAKMLMRIHGPVTNPTILDEKSNWSVRVNGTIDSGQTLLIDPQTRQVLLGGTSSRRAWLRGWPELAPGEHSLTWTGTGTSRKTLLQIDYCETYL